MMQLFLRDFALRSQLSSGAFALSTDFASYNASTYLRGTSTFAQPSFSSLAEMPVLGTAASTDAANYMLASRLSTVRVTSIKNSTTTSSLPIPELLFNVSNTVAYNFTFALVYATVSSTTGVKVGLSTGTFSSFTARAVIPVAAAGTDADMSGYIIASGGTVTAATTPVASTKYCAMVTGTILPSADGVLQLTYGTEVAGSAVSTFVGSYGMLTTL